MTINEIIDEFSFYIKSTPKVNKKRFENKYRNMIDKILANTSFTVVEWKNEKDFISFFVKDSYTNRLMYIFVTNIDIDKFGWRDRLLIRTANNTHHFVGKPWFYTTLNDLVKGLNNLNIVYNQSNYKTVLI